MSGYELRVKNDTRDNMRPDPQTLAATYRLSMLPKKRAFSLVKKSRKKQQNSSRQSATDSSASADDSLDTSGVEKDSTYIISGAGEESKDNNRAVYVGTTCWKIDEGGEDDSNDEDYDDDLRPESTHTEPGFQAQQTYATMCKALGIRPMRIFCKSLLTDQVAVCYQTLSTDDLKACATALVHTDNVEKVVFDDNYLGPLGTARIAEILPQKIEFRELAIRNNKIGSEGARLLCQALLNNNYIRKLDLSGNEFSEDDGQVFGELLEENHALREINLSHNNFRCKGGKLIAEGLAKNRFLKKLDLSWNHLRMDGAVALGESLIENSDLEELNVAWNGFHLRGCMAIGHALKHNSALVKLDLSCNRISELCLAQLLNGIKENSTLQCLKLPLNPLSPQSAYSILQFIDQHDSIGLNHVDLGDLCVYEEFKTFLAELQKSRDLTVIHGPILRSGLALNSGEIQQEDDEDVMDENPLIVLMEFCRLQNLRLVDMFNAIDTDRSRSLSYTEFTEGLQKVNIPLADNSLKMLLKILDRDGDGSIDFSELIDGQREYKRLVQEALREGPMDSNIVGQIGMRMKQHIRKKYLMRQF